jgi:hypothetical protein
MLENKPFLFIFRGEIYVVVVVSAVVVFEFF